MPDTPPAAGRIYIDAASAERLGWVLRDVVAKAAPTDHPFDRGFRAGAESAALTIERMADQAESPPRCVGSCCGHPVVPGFRACACHLTRAMRAGTA